LSAFVTSLLASGYTRRIIGKAALGKSLQKSAPVAMYPAGRSGEWGPPCAAEW